MVGCSHKARAWWREREVGLGMVGIVPDGATSEHYCLLEKRSEETGTGEGDGGMGSKVEEQNLLSSGARSTGYAR